MRLFGEDQCKGRKMKAECRRVLRGREMPLAVRPGRARVVADGPMWRLVGDGRLPSEGCSRSLDILLLVVPLLKVVAGLKFLGRQGLRHRPSLQETRRDLV